MKWVKRGLWAAAWGCWVWLGFGLYRELPRDLGPVVCRLPLRGWEWPQGLIGDSAELVTFQSDPKTHIKTIRRRDARTGELLGEIADGPLTEGRTVRLGFSPRFEHLLCGFSGCGLFAHPDEERARTLSQPIIAQDIHKILDVRAGVWRELPDFPFGSVSFHDAKPWAAFYVASSLGGRGSVYVLDLATGDRMFEWNESSRKDEDRKFKGAPFWIANDRLVIPTHRPRPDADTTAMEDQLEVWCVPTGERERVVSAPRASSDWDSDPAPSGRVLCRLNNEVGVFDVNAGRLVLSLPQPRSHPERRWRFENEHGLDWHVLSPEGSSLLTTDDNYLFEVVSGNMLWKPRPHEYVLWVQGRRFETFENWLIWTPWSGHRIATFATRDLRTGALLYRTWHPTLRHQIADGVSSVMIRGDQVLSFPPFVNFPLLALCQTILALPLVLLWAALRWRRKRRARVASVAS